jgi:hypothetical protein
MDDTITYAVCRKCGSRSMIIFFTKSTIGAVCKECRSYVFETEDIQSFLLKIQDKKTDKTVN